MRAAKAGVVAAGLLVATTCSGMDVVFEKTALINVRVKDQYVYARVCYEPSGSIAYYPWPAKEDVGRVVPFLIVEVESGDLAVQRFVNESGAKGVFRGRIVGAGIKCAEFNLSDSFVLEVGKNYRITYSFLFPSSLGNERKPVLIESNPVLFVYEK